MHALMPELDRIKPVYQLSILKPIRKGSRIQQRSKTAKNLRSFQENYIYGFTSVTKWLTCKSWDEFAPKALNQFSPIAASKFQHRWNYFVLPLIYSAGYVQSLSGKVYEVGWSTDISAWSDLKTTSPCSQKQEMNISFHDTGQSNLSTAKMIENVCNKSNRN